MGVKSRCAETEILILIRRDVSAGGASVLSTRSQERVQPATYIRECWHVTPADRGSQHLRRCQTTMRYTTSACRSTSSSRMYSVTTGSMSGPKVEAVVASHTAEFATSPGFDKTAAV